MAADRYFPEKIAQTRLPDDLPALIKRAWRMAHNHPELGNQILGDLLHDVEHILKEDYVASRDSIESLSLERARPLAMDLSARARRREKRLVESLATALRPQGINPHGQRVYMLWPDKDAEKPLYVGRSSNIFARLGNHMTDPRKRAAVNWVTVIDCPAETAAEAAEGFLISGYQPRLNISLRGNR